MADRPERRDVFISFASEDRAIAGEVLTRLRRDGVSVWDFIDCAESGSWHLNQLRALRDSKIAIFIVTPDSAASSACLDEAQRVVDPNQVQTIPIPLVVGSWDYLDSDLWLLLSKWNGVVASPSLDDDALHRLMRLVHDRLGIRPVASLSTGQALVAVKDDLCAYLEAATGEVSGSEIVAKARDLQIQHRGNMVAFSQFTHIDREVEAAKLLRSSDEQRVYLANYLRAFFDQEVEGAYRSTATRLAGHISVGDGIVVSEYSRVLRQTFKVLAESDSRTFQSLQIYIVSRSGMLLADDEPSRMVEELESLGGAVQMVPFSDWIQFLLTGVDDTGFSSVRLILFGVEALSLSGDVVFPQIVKELDALRSRSAFQREDMPVIAAGESYKVCREQAEVSKMIADPHYTVIPANAIDLVVTDIMEAAPSREGVIDMTPCVQAVQNSADQIRAKLWPAGAPLPVWNISDEDVAALEVLVADIDGTLTLGGTISNPTIRAMEALGDVGVKLVLCTGRSAGFAAGLAQYLPNVHAVLAENGAVYLDSAQGEVFPSVLDDGAVDGMQRVERCIEDVHGQYPDAVSGRDNFARVTDRTIEVSPTISPAVMAEIAAANDCRHTYSTVHHHFTASQLDKQQGVYRALPRIGLDHLDPRRSFWCVGDSLNDAALFDSGSFAVTIGVRSIMNSLESLGRCRPRYVTLRDGGEGFEELIGILSAARSAE